MGPSARLFVLKSRLYVRLSTPSIQFCPRGALCNTSAHKEARPKKREQHARTCASVNISSPPPRPPRTCARALERVFRGRADVPTDGRRPLRRARRHCHCCRRDRQPALCGEDKRTRCNFYWQVQLSRRILLLERGSRQRRKHNPRPPSSASPANDGTPVSKQAAIKSPAVPANVHSQHTYICHRHSSTKSARPTQQAS